MTPPLATALLAAPSGCKKDVLRYAMFLPGTRVAERCPRVGGQIWSDLGLSDADFGHIRVIASQMWADFDQTQDGFGRVPVLATSLPDSGGHRSDLHGLMWGIRKQGSRWLSAALEQHSSAGWGHQEPPCTQCGRRGRPSGARAAALERDRYDRWSDAIASRTRGGRKLGAILRSLPRVWPGVGLEFCANLWQSARLD